MVGEIRTATGPTIRIGGGRSRPLRNFQSGAAQATAAVGQGLQSLAVGLAQLEQRNHALDVLELDQAVADFDFDVEQEILDIKRKTVPGDRTVLQRGSEMFDKRANEFIEKQKPELRQQATNVVNQSRIRHAKDLVNFDLQQKDTHAENIVQNSANRKVLEVAEDPAMLDQKRLEVATELEVSGLPPERQVVLHQNFNQRAEEAAYKKQRLDQETGVTGQLGSDVEVRRDRNGFWQTPGLQYDLGGKKRRLPVSREYVKRLMGATRRVDPNMEVRIVSAAQHSEAEIAAAKKRGVTLSRAKGSSVRHDHKGGEGDTTDFVLVVNGKAVTPAQNKELYARAIKSYAAAGFTGIGHYPWGIHVGGGKPAFWGPDKTRKTADPELRKAYEAGRNNTTGKLRLSPDFANIPAERFAEIEGQVATEANRMNKERNIVAGQAIVDDAIELFGLGPASTAADWNAGFDWIRNYTSGTGRDKAFSGLREWRELLKANASFDDEQQEEFDREHAQRASEVIKNTAPTLKEALTAARGEFRGKVLEDVEARLRILYKDEATARVNNALTDAPRIVQQAMQGSESEEEARQLLLGLEDPDLRKEALELLKNNYAARRRSTKDSESKQAQELVNSVPAELSLTEADVLLSEQVNGEQLEAARKEFAAQKQRAEKDRDERVDQLIGAGREFLLNMNDPARVEAGTGGELLQFMESLPEKDRQLLQQSKRFKELAETEDFVKKGQTSARTSDGKTLQAFREMTAEQQAATDLQTVFPKLTLAEQGQAGRIKAAAEKEIQGAAESSAAMQRARSLVEQYTPQKVKNKRGAPVERDRFTQRQKNMVLSDVRDFVESFLPNRPSDQQLEQFVARSTMEVQGDTSPWVPFSGDFKGAFGEFFDVARDDQGNIITAQDGSVQFRSELTLDQLRVMRVSFDSIPPKLLTDIKNSLRARGIDDQDEDLIEELAGAYATNNGPRVQQLIKDAR